MRAAIRVPGPGKAHARLAVRGRSTKLVCGPLRPSCSPIDRFVHVDHHSCHELWFTDEAMLIKHPRRPRPAAAPAARGRSRGRCLPTCSGMRASPGSSSGTRRGAGSSVRRRLSHADPDRPTHRAHLPSAWSPWHLASDPRPTCLPPQRTRATRRWRPSAAWRWTRG